MRFLKDNGLTLILLNLVAPSIFGQWIALWYIAMEPSRRRSQPILNHHVCLASPEFPASVFENWESEFLQMATYVALTARFIQRGSAVSKGPGAPARDTDIEIQASKPGAPVILRWGPVERAPYAWSLRIALTSQFLLSFVVACKQSARIAGQDGMEHGGAASKTSVYRGDVQLWCGSFQKWRGALLSTAVRAGSLDLLAPAGLFRIQSCGGPASPDRGLSECCARPLLLAAFRTGPRFFGPSDRSQRRNFL
jgi:hypothetical protein